mgnify:CR=1 FL=1
MIMRSFYMTKMSYDFNVAWLYISFYYNSWRRNVTYGNVWQAHPPQLKNEDFCMDLIDLMGLMGFNDFMN